MTWRQISARHSCIVRSEHGSLNFLFRSTGTHKVTMYICFVVSPSQPQPPTPTLILSLAHSTVSLNNYAPCLRPPPPNPHHSVSRSLCLSPLHYHSVSKSLCLSPLHYHRVSKSLCLSPLHYHSVSKSLCLSPLHYHRVSKSLCLSPLRYHSVSKSLCPTRVTRPLSQCL